MDLKILTYNVWLMPPIVSYPAGLVGLEVAPHKSTRAKLIADHPEIGSADVLVLCEAFCKRTVDGLTARLGEQFGLVHRTPVLSSRASRVCRGKLLSGGIVILSRYPILQSEELLFGWRASARDDGLADKGCARATIDVPSVGPVHVFATHTQAWSEQNCLKARDKQFDMIRAFIQDSGIPEEEPVLVVGDLNVDRHAEEGARYRNMLERLDCLDFWSAYQSADAAQSEHEHPIHTFDALKNPLARKGPSSSGNCEHLDYVLASKAHAKRILASRSRVIRLTAKEEDAYVWAGSKIVDLSDHYPVETVLQIAKLDSGVGEELMST